MLAKIFASTLIAASISATAMAGISANDKIGADDALLLGGTQAGWIDIDGQNRGDTILELAIRDGDTTKTVATVNPGKSFNQSVPKNQILVVRNTSVRTNARVYWHISRYSKSANARLQSSEQ